MEQFTVRQVRAYLGLSLPEMAKKLNMHPNTYRNKELGLRKWYLDEAQLLAKVSGIDFSKIVF